MAEVTLTMVDPEAYEGPVVVEPEVVVEHEGPADWDEDDVRRRRAAEAEEIIANEQPGRTVEEDEAAATAEYDGKTYYFCSAACRKDFEEDPEAYLRQE